MTFRLGTDQETLLADILRVCTSFHNIKVDTELFFKLFKLHNSHRKILQVTAKEVDRFQNFKKEFDTSKTAFTDREKVDLYFEFQVRTSHSKYQMDRLMTTCVLLGLDARANYSVTAEAGN